jgi:hypothetical protein
MAAAAARMRSASGLNGSAFTRGGALGAVLLLLVAALGKPVVASLDPALCPFVLGYNPVFNADGSVLSCVKGMSSSSFCVESVTVSGN